MTVSQITTANLDRLSAATLAHELSALEARLRTTGAAPTYGLLRAERNVLADVLEQRLAAGAQIHQLVPRRVAARAFVHLQAA